MKHQLLKSQKNFQILFAMAAVLGLPAAGTSGCIRQTEFPIIAEKQSPDSFSGTPAESDGNQEDADLGDSETGTQNLIKELAKAPEYYQTSITEKRIQIEADAPLETPDVSRLPIIEIESKAYTPEDQQAAMLLLKKETGISEWVSLEDVSGYISSDGIYNLSFGQGADADGIPMIWLTNLTCSDASNDEVRSADLSGFSLTEAAKESLEAELKAKAETLLGQLSLSDFHLNDSQWKKISSAEASSAALVPTGKYGLLLTFTRSFEGIPTVNSENGWASAPMSPCQYVEFLYQEDGTLLRLKNINQERISANMGNESSLMPFNAITQIFEQYLKYYRSIYKPTLYSYQSGWTEEAEAYDSFKDSPSPESPDLSIMVTSVKFRYQLSYPGQGSNASNKEHQNGRLIPVWAFYGTPQVKYQKGNNSSYTSASFNDANPDSLLVTINAINGEVYGKE